MTVETFVILNLERYNHMQEELQNKKKRNTSPPKSPPPPKMTKDNDYDDEKVKSEDENESQGESQKSLTESNPNDSVDVSDQSYDKKVSEKTKSMIKKKTVFQNHFEKLFKALEKYKGIDTNFPNLQQLIKAAIGSSKRTLPNEEKFYKLLLDHQLFHLVKNQHKIKKFWPSWFRIG